MADITREQVVTALETLLGSITANGLPLKTIGRRLRDPENVKSDDRPALFLVEHLDHWDESNKSPDIPAVRSMTVWGILYTDVGADQNAIPMMQINQFIESIEAALDPDNAGFTLGGIVHSCKLAGEGIRAAGDTTGKSLAAIPIRIVLP
jgi:hypothetical protein